MRIVSMLFALLLCGAPVFGANIQEIKAGDIKARLDGGEPLVLVNTLPPLIYQAKHIQGSVNIPIERIHQELPATYPDKSQLLVFYCMGRKCVYSVQAAEAAQEMGYTNVFAFRDGIPGWEKAGYPMESELQLPEDKVPQVTAEELAGGMDAYFVVDIRGDERIMTGVIPGTNMWLPLVELMDRVGELPKDKPVLIYDTADKLTLITGRYLMTKGYRVVRLGGGVTSWIAAGKSVDPAK